MVYLISECFLPLMIGGDRNLTFLFVKLTKQGGRDIPPRAELDPLSQNVTNRIVVVRSVYSRPLTSCRGCGEVRIEQPQC